jgi:hypothetical protein
MDLDHVKWFKISEENIDTENQNKRKKGKTNSNEKNKEAQAKDFSNGPDIITLINTPNNVYGDFLSKMDDNEVRKQLVGKNIYEVTIKNVGGLVMPLTIEWIFTDGSTEIDKLPAEVWRINEYEIKKTFVKTKEASKVNLDPNFEFADVNMQNNSFPKTETPSEFDAFKNKKSEK